MEGGGCSSTSSLMAFGDNSNGLCPMMMLPPVTSSHPNVDTNTLFLPLPPPSHNHDQNRHGSGSSSMMLEDHNNHNLSTNTGCYFMENHGNNNNDGGCSSVKAKIMAHPHYQRLLAAYVNCQKIGAPPEVVARLEEACGAAAAAVGRTGTGYIGEDPALDQFMEAYCEMLTKYEQELSKPFKEAMLFLSRIECQFKALTVASSDSGGLCRATGGLRPPNSFPHPLPFFFDPSPNTQFSFLTQSTVSPSQSTVFTQSLNVSTQSSSSRSPPAISLSILILPRQPINPPPHVIPHPSPAPVNTHSMITRSKASAHTCYTTSVSTSDPTSDPSPTTEPTSVTEALKSSAWLAAMKKES
ncbi:hypothetical protein U1Q18_008849 [Sarracenia purpurea var. burkii]